MSAARCLSPFPPRTGADNAQRIYNLSVAILRGGVALQAIGVGLQRLGLAGGIEDESPVFGLLAFDWRWPEEVAQRVDDTGAWLYFICGLALVVLPLFAALRLTALGRAIRRAPVWLWQAPLCIIITAWQAIGMFVAWQRGGYFMAEWTLASESARLALPVVLLLLTGGSWSAAISARRMNAALWVLRVAASLTFLAHGLKACLHSPVFVDYLIVAANRIGWDVQQATAEAVLRGIGVVDIVLAILMVATRWRVVAFYMAAWALIGAFARLVHTGWAAHFEVLIRAGNYCVPLIVGLSYQMSRPRLSRPSDQEESDASP